MVTLFAMNPRKRLLFAALAALFFGCPLVSSAQLLGPIRPYESFADSPFAPLLPQFSYFHLETYEEPGAPANSPGVSITASGASVIGPGTQVDSVDGGGNAGHSLFATPGSTGIRFTFNAGVLGALPTHAGIAWTDGELAVHFTAFDQNGRSLGTIDDSSGHGFSGGDGDPTNYRFFGAINSGGISAIFISNDSGGIEVDHLQYGLVPEPSTLTDR